MRIRFLATVTMSLIMCALVCIPARAQLSTYVDDSGNVVFTNANPPPVSPTAKKRAPAVTSATSISSDPSASALAASASQAATASGSSTGAPSVQLTSAVATSASKPAPPELDSMVLKTAQRHHVDPNLVRAVISTESNWNAAAVSRRGAQGLMQLIPETAHTLGVGNPFDPAQNVDAGTRYLGMLLERYNGDLTKTLAAYNAGPGAVDRFGGVPNFRETRDYVRKVTSTYFGPSVGPGLQPQAPPPPPLRPTIYRAVRDDGRVIFTNE
jgi:soluble lytic murein transglycosylase-like protein